MVLWLLLARPSMAATIAVGPFQATTTIQDAVDLAQPGDILNLDPFPFEEDVYIDKDLTILGGGGSANHYLAGDITIDDATVTITGMTLDPTVRAITLTNEAILFGNDLKFFETESDVDGVGVYLNNRAKVVLNNCAFTDLTATKSKGAGIYSNQGDVALVNVSFSGVHAQHGGAIWATGSTIALESVSIDDATADTGPEPGLGGAISVEAESVLIVSDSEISGSLATQDGGALWIDGSQANIAGLQIRQTQATGNGGGLWLRDSIVVLDEVIVDEGSAVDGGLIYSEAGTLTIKSSSLTNGVATARGGALSAYETALTLDSGTIANNVVTDTGGLGGGIALSSAPSALFTGTQFTANESSGAGGGAYLSDVPVAMGGCGFTENHSGLGGGYYQEGAGNLTVLDGKFLANTATVGAGLYWNAADQPLTVSVTGVSFEDNVAAGNGGGLLIRNGAIATLLENRFARNEADQGAGALIQHTDRTVQTRNLYCGNYAYSKGGGVWSSFGLKATYENNLFVENVSRGDGGGLYVGELDEAVFHNNAFLSNEAGDRGGGARSEAQVLTFEDNVVAYTVSGTGLSAQASAAQVDYNAWYLNSASNASDDLAGSNLGPNALFLDPQFTLYSADGNCGNDNLALQPGSPLVNAGNPNNTDPDGSRGDVGPFGGDQSPEGVWVDADEDGYPVMWDCFDGDAKAYPGATEIPYDGIDNDCEGGDACDLDLDGFNSVGCPSGGLDCDDSENEIHPGAAETPEDDIDQDCNGADLRLQKDEEPPDDLPLCACNNGSTGGPAVGGVALLGLFAVLRRRRPTKP